MNVKFSFPHKYFWIKTYIIYLLVTIVSYGFIKDLSFYGEDFGDIYNFLFGGENQPFPYQGIKYILSPFYLFFGNQPSGYFVVAFFLYTLVTLLLAFVIWKYTKNKLLAFISGLLFAAGYIGSESMFMIEMAIPEMVYLISLLGFLIFYKNYSEFYSRWTWLISFILYTFALLLVSQRAHSFIFIVFLTDLFLAWNSKIMSIYENITSSLKRIFPFILIFIGVYIGIPLYLHKTLNNYVGTVWTWQSYNQLSKNSYLAFLSDLGNFLIPSFYIEKLVGILQILDHNLAIFLIIGIFIIFLALFYLGLKGFLTKKKKFIYLYLILFLFNLSILVNFTHGQVSLFLNSYIGLFLISLIFGLIFFITLNFKIRKFLAFLTFSWLASYFIYHIHEANRVHLSTHYYLLSGFPFFASIIALILVKGFMNQGSKGTKYVGYGLVFIVFSLYLYASYLSPLKQNHLDRNIYLQSFISTLKNTVPDLGKTKSLFYFDIVNDARILNLYASFLFAGSYTEEIALATFFKENGGKIKIVKDYDSFVKEKDSGIYKNTYIFFYDIENQLHNLTPQFQSEKNHNSLTISDFSKVKMGLYNNFSEGNTVEVKNNKILYKSAIFTTSERSQAKNDILEIDIDDYNFPSYKPIRLDITFTGINFFSIIDRFPFRDGLASEPPKEYPPPALGKEDNISEFINYINERELFKEKASIQSSGDYYPYRIQNVIDNHLNTSWKPWFGGKPAWIKVTFPEEYTFSEIRWVSTEDSPPIAYEYQISTGEEGPWETIFSITDRNAEIGKYIVDKIPLTKAKYFRMFIPGRNYLNNPTIAELEFIKTQSSVSSEQANFFLEHPLAYVANKIALEKISALIRDNLYLSVYPISDKFLKKDNIQRVRKKIKLDGREHTYSFILPPGGTKLNNLLIEFPNVPFFAQIEKLSLSQID